MPKAMHLHPAAEFLGSIPPKNHRRVTSSLVKQFNDAVNISIIFLSKEITRMRYLLGHDAEPGKSPFRQVA